MQRSAAVIQTSFDPGSSCPSSGSFSNGSNQIPPWYVPSRDPGQFSLGIMCQPFGMLQCLQIVSLSFMLFVLQGVFYRFNLSVQCFTRCNYAFQAILDALCSYGLEFLQVRLKRQRGSFYGISVKNIGGGLYVHVFRLGLGLY